jgi:hypothetical protein
VHTLKEALELPLYIKDRKASPEEITKIYNAVSKYALSKGKTKNMPEAEEYEEINNGLSMTDPYIENMFKNDLRAKLSDLKCISRRKIYALFFIGVFLQSTTCVALSRGASDPEVAQVLDRKGFPCFTVNNNKKVELTSIEVEEVSIPTLEVLDDVWAQFLEWNTEKKPITVDQNTCFLYGTPLDNKDKRSKAKKLEPGKIYRVNFFRQNFYNDGYYSAYFCLVSAGNGSLKIHQLKGSIDPCKPLNPTVPPVFHIKIIDKKSVPCFSIRKNEGNNLKFESISVKPSQANDEISNSLWTQFSSVPKVERENEKFLPNLSSCLPYGTQLKTNDQSLEAKQLESNKIYKVTMMYSWSNRSQKDREYQGYFCLSHTKNGDTKVNEVPYDEQKKAWDFDVCNKLTEEQ